MMTICLHLSENLKLTEEITKHNQIYDKYPVQIERDILYYCFSERKGEGKVRLLTTTHYVREINA